MYDYDNNGNQTTTTVNGTVTVTNTYDNRNQLIKTVTGDNMVKNGYNGEGYRIEKKTNGELTRYLYESDKVVLEVDGSGNQTGRNVYGTNLLVRTTDGLNYYYMYNGHADVTALLKADGTIAATYYYDAFGNITDTTGSVNNSITFAGYQYDEETGLYYLNARMYDPKTARFLQEDTFNGDKNDPLSLNLYTYCANNPIIYHDPTGHKPKKYTQDFFIDENYKEFVYCIPGSSGSYVNETQRILINLGLLKYKKPNGVYDNTTKQAMIRYQKDHDLIPNGIVEQSNMAYLRSSNKVRNYKLNGKSEKEIREIERRMNLSVANIDYKFPQDASEFIAELNSFEERDKKMMFNTAGFILSFTPGLDTIYDVKDLVLDTKNFKGKSMDYLNISLDIASLIPGGDVAKDVNKIEKADDVINYTKKADNVLDYTKKGASKRVYLMIWQKVALNIMQMMLLQ